MRAPHLKVVSEMDVDEQTLVREARSGDEDAFAELVRRHSGGLHRVVARVVGDEEEAWDVVQMSFVRAWTKLERYDTRWRFSTWLYRIGTNLAIDVVRARSSRQRVHEEGGLRVVAAPPDTTHLAREREIERILSGLVEALSPQQRAAFVLRELEGLATEDVGRVLGCSSATVRNHVFHARRVLRSELEQRHPELLPRKDMS